MEPWSSVLQNPLQSLPLAKDRKYNGVGGANEEALRLPAQHPSLKVGEAAPLRDAHHRRGKEDFHQKGP